MASSTSDNVAPAPQQQQRSDENGGLPANIAENVKMCYRSFGLGMYAVGIRFLTMPLEKTAMVMNSSQVNGSGSAQLRQTMDIVFKEGFGTPYKAVGRASITAWFFQYSVMGFVFQSVDRSLSSALGIDRIPYGDDLMQSDRTTARAIKDKKSSSNISSIATTSTTAATSSSGGGSTTLFAFKALLAPAVAGMIESVVANRAEAQRFFGIAKFKSLEAQLNWSAAGRALGPGFLSNWSRNFIMSGTSFVFTPIMYKKYYPEDSRSPASLFWFGLGANIFIGNVAAITQQSLWGRALDYAAEGGAHGARNVSYRAVVTEGLKAEGVSAFFTPTKWSTRVLMNAPIQGTMPWFYNQVLPQGEATAMRFAGKLLGY
mmetsp:Transcript_84046/g.163317  ORF Transcript_84046/g.163317 Transcript_84046/m.163317 type:complete len:373 (-) Transcript_84046:259-1377(-)